MYNARSHLPHFVDASLCLGRGGLHIWLYSTYYPFSCRWSNDYVSLWGKNSAFSLAAAIDYIYTLNDFDGVSIITFLISALGSFTETNKQTKHIPINISFLNSQMYLHEQYILSTLLLSSIITSILRWMKTTCLQHHQRLNCESTRQYFWHVKSFRKFRVFWERKPFPRNYFSCAGIRSRKSKDG